MRTFRTLLLLFFFAIGSPSIAADTTYRIVTLSSGKPIKVLGVGKITFAKGPPALVLKYETELSIDDKEALEKEVSEIWRNFRVDVENAKLKEAIISANEKTGSGFITRSRGFNFGFSRGSEGQWFAKVP